MSISLSFSLRCKTRLQKPAKFCSAKIACIISHRRALQYFGVMDCSFKDELSCAIRSNERSFRLPEASLRFAMRQPKETVVATYVFNAGETPEEVLFNINQYARVESPPVGASPGANMRQAILLSSPHIRQLNWRKNLARGTKPSVFIVRSVSFGMDSSPLMPFRG